MLHANYLKGPLIFGNHPVDLESKGRNKQHMAVNFWGALIITALTILGSNIGAPDFRKPNRETIYTPYLGTLDPSKYILHIWVLWTLGVATLDLRGQAPSPKLLGGGHGKGRQPEDRKRDQPGSVV